MNVFRLALIVVAMALVVWVRLLPLSLDGAEHGAESAVRAQISRDIGATGGEAQAAVDNWIGERRDRFERMLNDERERRRDFYSFASDDGLRFPYLGGFDSYLWLRSARNLLRHGSACDSVVDGECRDEFTLAPVGTRGRYAASLHVDAIAATHRAASLFYPALPLSVSAYLLSVLVGALGVIPAFLLGSRFGGSVGGFICAVLSGLNTMVLFRSFGADNDIWNVVLPFVAVWAAVEAIYGESRRRRTAYVAVAAIATGVHAAIWAGWIFTSGIIVLGFLANALLWGMRRAVHGTAADSRSQTLQAVLLLGGYLVAASAASWAAGAAESPLSSVREMLRSLPIAPRTAAPVGVVPQLEWPSLFGTVGELRSPNLGGIASSMSGPLYFFIGWLGLLLLMLPRSDWKPRHFALLIGGNLLYRYLLSLNAINPWNLAGLLLLPLAIGLGAYLADRDGPVEDQGAGMMIILWFLGGLVLAHRGTRFLIILAPPLAVLCSVTVGRVSQWIERQPWAAAPAVRTVVMLALLACAYPPVAQATKAARAYRPIMNDNWHGVLDRLRVETPADAIINTWWDYGYFVKHVADRRVLSDGGTLSTRVHHWFARALIADSEAESLGLLRMLNCGSDAFPEPEGRRGAFAALKESGLDAVQSYATIIELAAMEREEGRQHLLSLGLSNQRAAVVIERTHCLPPPAYLLLPDDLARSIGWRLLGGWDFLEAAAATLDAGDGGDRAAELASRFGVERPIAEAAVRRVEATGYYRPQTPSYLTARWSTCAGERQLRCEIGAAMPSGGVLRAVVLQVDDPAATRFVVHRPPHGEVEVRPASVVLVDTDGLSEIASDGEAEPSVLIDLAANRVLVGSAQLLRSTFTRLIFLDGRHLRHFESFDRRSGLSVELRTWKIAW